MSIVFSPAENNIGQRNIETAKLYNQLDPSLRDEHSNTEGITLEATSGDPNAEERGRFGKIFKSDEKLRDEVKSWAGQVQLKVSVFLLPSLSRWPAGMLTQTHRPSAEGAQ